MAHVCPLGFKWNLYSTRVHLGGSAGTFRSTQSHDQWTVAFVQLSQTRTASVISDDGQLLQDQRLVWTHI